MSQLEYSIVMKQQYIVTQKTEPICTGSGSFFMGLFLFGEMTNSKYKNTLTRKTLLNHSGEKYLKKYMNKAVRQESQVNVIKMVR